MEKQTRNPASIREGNVSVLFTKTKITATRNPRTPAKKTIEKYQSDRWSIVNFSETRII
jgi:hypothetical protein